MATESRTTGRVGPDGGTELGVDAKILAALGYVFNLLGALVLLVLEDNDYVRHHAAQALLFTALVVVARLAVGFVAFFLRFVPVVGDLLATALGIAVWALAGLVFLFLAYKGFVGERYTLPGFGQYVTAVEGAF